MFSDFDLHPDSGLLAIRHFKDTEQSEITLWDIGSRTRLADIGRGPGPQRPRVSPDGTQIVFFDNTGRLYSHSVTDRETDLLVDWPGRFAVFPSWSPDSRSLAFASHGGTNPDTDTPPKLFWLNLPNRHIEPITHKGEPGADGFPQWSPYGQELLFQRRFFDPPRKYTTIILTDQTGSTRKQLPIAEGGSQAAGRPCWTPDGRHVLVTETVDGKRALKAFDAENLELVYQFENGAIVGGCFDPYHGRVLCVLEDELQLHAFPSGKPVARLGLSDLAPLRMQLTGPSVAFSQDGGNVYFLGEDGGLYRWDLGGSAELILQDEPVLELVQHTWTEYSFTARDGLEIPVQRYVPSESNGRAIIYVEGGPGGEINPNDSVVFHLLGEGYEVVRPAYRGAAGCGPEHLDANRGECGQADVWDVVDCGVDWRSRFGGAGQPLAVSGFSYGGYLTFSALGYREASWSCGVTLWGATMIPPGAWAKGLPQGVDTQTALRETSAVTRADEIRFPLLILHGGRDTTPTEDVVAIQKTVRESGYPCELVVFEDDGHGLFASREEMMDQMLGFLDQHL